MILYLFEKSILQQQSLRIHCMHLPHVIKYLLKIPLEISEYFRKQTNLDIVAHLGYCFNVCLYRCDFEWLSDYSLR